MKTLLKSLEELQDAGRWDIDYHLPPIGITRFDSALLVRVDEVAEVAATKRNPSREPEASFLYIDISCIDSTTGMIGQPQDLLGEEAPSRARKVVRAFDVLVSTVRPTRGAVAVVPPYLHNQIASTGFSVLRPTSSVNPFFLQFVLRLPSTLEQFRKWSTGSSYPAILDEDVAKTLIPLPDIGQQDAIVAKLSQFFLARADYLARANQSWDDGLLSLAKSLANSWEDDDELPSPSTLQDAETLREWMTASDTNSLVEQIERLPELDVDPSGRRGRRTGTGARSRRPRARARSED
jgi:hypothetical protein